MKNFITKNFKKCRSVIGRLSLFMVTLTNSGAVLLKKAVPVLDHGKALILWLAELFAFIGITVLIMKGVTSIYIGDVAEGFITLGGCIILAVLCILFDMVIGQPNEQKAKQK